MNCMPKYLSRFSTAQPLLSRHLSTIQNSYAYTPKEKVPITENLPSRAQVVIAGSGLIGNSVAYHLMEHGWNDVVIIDKGNIADGTSKYGSGMLGLFRPNNERAIVHYCIELYRKLQSMGHDVGLEEIGSLNLANTKDRLLSLQRRAGRYKPTGLDCKVLSPSEIKDYHPYVYTDDLHGAVWVPEDAVVHPKLVSEVLALLAAKGGASFVGECGVTKVLTKCSNSNAPVANANWRVTGVETTKGTIECEYFVNCAGIWARELGKLSEPKVKVPVCAAEHFFLTFKEIPELKGKTLPNVRDYDNHIYLRSWRNSFLMGAFEIESRPYQTRAGAPKFDWSRITDEHWHHMQPYISKAKRRIPVLMETKFDFLLNTPDAFTPDGKWIIGEAPEVGNYYVCAGMNGNSLQGAAGVGKAIADWMVNKLPPGNMLDFDLARFTNLHNNQLYLSLRIKESVGRHYKLMYPLISDCKSARKIRTSPIYRELEARGAVFGERMGWERPLYFEQYHDREDPPAQPPERGTFGKPEFYNNIEGEYLVCREGVGIIDMSSFAKFRIRGEKNSLIRYLQRLCTNDVDFPVGGIIPTGMLNEGGGYENDCLLVRQAGDAYFLVSPTNQQTRIAEWMLNHLPDDVVIQDVTSMYTVLTVVGPKAKDLMQQMTKSDMSMHPFTSKIVNMGYASNVMVFAVTQTGEPGYSLYIPSEFALHLYDSIMKVGDDYGIRNVGHLAMRFLRIEKFIPFWGEELTSETTPNEVGRAFKVKYEKTDFIGKAALLEQKKKGVSKRLVQFQFTDLDKDVDLWPWGGEAIYRNGEYVGFVTNSAYGFTIHKMVALGFIQHPETIKGNRTPVDGPWLTDKEAIWSINIAGRMFPVTLHIHPPKMPVINTDAVRMMKRQKHKTKPGQSPLTDIVKKKKDK